MSGAPGEDPPETGTPGPGWTDGGEGAGRPLTTSRESSTAGGAVQPTGDVGSRLWDFFSTFVEARAAFRVIRRRYERRVIGAAARRGVHREDLVLPPALLERLFDVQELVRVRDAYLDPLRRQALDIFGERGDEGLLDTYCGHAFHEWAILCEEHRSVSRFRRVHDPARYRELFHEVGSYYPTRLRRIRRLFRLGMARLEQLLPAWARQRVMIRSAYLFGDALGRRAWREGLEGLYARMYPEGGAVKGLLEAARSFHAAGFDAQAATAGKRALARATAVGALPATEAGRLLEAEVRSFLEAAVPPEPLLGAPGGAECPT